MKKIFALVIAGSFLFAGCGSHPVVAVAEKTCECMKAPSEACTKELAALTKEAGEAGQPGQGDIEEAAKIAAACVGAAMGQ